MSQQKSLDKSVQSYNSPTRQMGSVQKSTAKARQSSKVLNTSSNLNNDTLMLSQRQTNKKSQNRSQMSQSKDLGNSDLVQISQSLHFKTTAMKSYEKDKLIEELSSLLKQKIQELSAEQQSNARLKQKVEEFQQVNQKNISTAEQKILQQQEAIESIKQDAQAQKQLNQQLRDQMQVIVLNKYDKQKLEDELSTAKQEISYQQLYLSQMAELEQKDELALDFWRKRLQREMLFWLRFVAQKQKAIKIYLSRKKQQQTQTALTQFFANWQRYVVYNKLIASKNQLNCQNLSYTYLQEWKRSTKQLKLRKKQRQAQQKRLTLLFFCEWKQYINIKRRKVTCATKLQKFRKAHLLKKCFRRLLHWKNLYQDDPYQECQNMKRAEQYHALGIKSKNFQIWKAVVQNYYVPLRNQLRSSDQYHLDALKSKCYFRWKSIKHIMEMNNEKADHFRANTERQWLIRLFDSWHISYHQIAVSKRKIQGNLIWIQRKKYFKQWKTSLSLLYSTNTKLGKMEKYHKTRLAKVAFGRLRQHWARSKVLARKFRQLSQIHEMNQLRQNFLCFAQNIRHQVEKKQKKREMDNHFLKKYLVIMSVFAQKSRRCKRAKQVQAIYCQNQQIALLVRIVKGWRLHAATKNRDRRIIAKVQRDRAQMLYWEFLAKLQESGRDQLKFQILELQKQIDHDQVCLEQELETNKLLQMEKSDVSAQYQQLSIEHEQHLLQVQEQQQLMEDAEVKCQDALQQKAKLELDLEFKEKELKDLEQRLESTRSQLLTSTTNYEEAVKVTRSENEDLRSQLAAQGQQLQSKNKEILDTQSALNQRVSQNENIIKEMGDKIEEQSSQIQVLADNIEAKEQEILSLVNNLKAITEEYDAEKQEVSNLNQLISKKETEGQAQLAKLEEQLKQRSREVELKEQEIENSQHQIRCLKQDIKKYQYEVEFLKKEQSGKTEEFINKLKQQYSVKIFKNNTNSSLNESRLSAAAPEKSPKLKKETLVGSSNPGSAYRKSEIKRTTNFEPTETLLPTEIVPTQSNMNRSSSAKKLSSVQQIFTTTNKQTVKMGDFVTPKTQAQINFDKKQSMSQLAGKIRHNEPMSQEKRSPDRIKELEEKAESKAQIKSQLEQRIKILDRIMDSQIQKIQQKTDED